MKINYRRSSPEHQSLLKAQKDGSAFNQYKKTMAAERSHKLANKGYTKIHRLLDKVKRFIGCSTK